MRDGLGRGLKWGVELVNDFFGKSGARGARRRSEIGPVKYAAHFTGERERRRKKMRKRGNAEKLTPVE
jgi:hypothetical protein